MDKRYLIILGDSFCSSPHGWPGELSNLLGLDLICRGFPGNSWWPARQHIFNLSNDVLGSTEVIIFVHTNSGRIPCQDLDIGTYDLNNLDPSDEKQMALILYYKYIHDHDFLEWAQHRWFDEINQRFKNKKLCHLHSFPWSTDYQNIEGINVITDLCSISLREKNIGISQLINDTRLNHLSDNNNKILAKELEILIKDYQSGKISLDISKFD